MALPKWRKWALQLVSYDRIGTGFEPTAPGWARYFVPSNSQGTSYPRSRKWGGEIRSANQKEAKKRIVERNEFFSIHTVFCFVLVLQPVSEFNVASSLFRVSFSSSPSLLCRWISHRGDFAQLRFLPLPISLFHRNRSIIAASFPLLSAITSS